MFVEGIESPCSGLWVSGSMSTKPPHETSQELPLDFLVFGQGVAVPQFLLGRLQWIRSQVQL